MKTFFQWVFGIIFGSVLLLVAIVSLNFSGTLGSIISAPGRVIQQTLETNNIVGNYEWFHQQVRDIDTARGRVRTNTASIREFETMAGPRETWKLDDRQEWARLNSVVTGSRNYYLQLIQDYNARAAMLNRSVFRDRSLPEMISPEEF